MHSLSFLSIDRAVFARPFTLTAAKGHKVADNAESNRFTAPNRAARSLAD